MNIKLKFCDIVFSFDLEKNVTIKEDLKKYIYEGNRSDVNIKVTWNWERYSEKIVSKQLGEDLLQRYYYQNNNVICTMKARENCDISQTICNENYRELICVINDGPFLIPITSLESILRFIPIRKIFQSFNALFLHASQVSIGETGIVFIGPSGIGKTTQSKLWEQYQSAELICNDRTLIRKQDDKWHTYGYPIDGSSPVKSNKVNKLGCIVVLEQSTENIVTKLNVAQTIQLVLPNVVLDLWSSVSIEKATNDIIELYKENCIYKLACTADKRAVNCLNETLIKDGVLNND